MLEKAKSAEPSTGADSKAITQPRGIYTQNKDHGKTFEPREVRQGAPHEQDFNRPTEVISDPSLQVENHNIPSAFWLNDSGSLCFSNVDHLLSPGFYVPEITLQPFFDGYGNVNGVADSVDQYNMPLLL